MKSLLLLSLGVVCLFSTALVHGQANTSLSNLATTSVNSDLLPSADNTRSIGSATLGWKQVFVSQAVYLGGSKFVSFGSAITLRNTAVGYNALSANTNGTFNTVLGASAMQFNTTGFGNIAVGYSALNANTTGYSNMAIGIRSLNANTTGHNLIGIGDSTLLHQNGGSGFNIAIGSKALYSNTTGDHNTAIGSSSFYSNTTGRNNVGIGSSALYNNTSGAENNAFGHGTLLLNTTGSSNVAIGAFAMNNNSSGYSNIAIGSRALNANKTGSQSIAIGDSALYADYSGGVNVAVGHQALYFNTTGQQNVAMGFQTLYANADGEENVAVGIQSLSANTSGSDNVAVGPFAANGVTTGNSNTAIGASAGYYDGTGNTSIGYDAIPASGTQNATALGYFANTTASNQVRVGDGSVTSIGGAVGWSNLSDGRFKKNIKANVPGLAFIKELRPVTYNFDPVALKKFIEAAVPRPKSQKKNNTFDALEAAGQAEKAKILYTGFVAQEVEATAKKMNFDFSGVDAPKNEKDYYGLRLGDFVPPLVEAVKELDSTMAKKSVVDSLQAKIDSLETRLQRLETLIQNPNTSGTSLSDAKLLQNSPNPFVSGTTISYVLPRSFGRAKLQVTDMAGRVIKAVSVTGAGRGNLNIDASALSAGVYNYSLYVDDKMVETKQMILSK